MCDCRIRRTVQSVVDDSLSQTTAADVTDNTPLGEACEQIANEALELLEFETLLPHEVSEDTTVGELITMLGGA